MKESIAMETVAIVILTCGAHVCSASKSGRGSVNSHDQGSVSNWDSKGAPPVEDLIC